MKLNRILFLASGRGSNFSALAKAILNKDIPQAIPVGLICNKDDAPVLQSARELGIPVSVLGKRKFQTPLGKWDRPAYEIALEKEIATYQPDWICLAGYMLMLGKPIVQRWRGRILNIHPSLLPDFPGLDAQRQALQAGVTKTGCTVHLVTEGLDDGPILAQSSIDILPGDDENSLIHRLLPVEHATYVQVLKRICTERLELDGGRAVWRLI